MLTVTGQHLKVAISRTTAGGTLHPFHFYISPLASALLSIHPRDPSSISSPPVALVLTNRSAVARLSKQPGNGFWNEKHTLEGSHPSRRPDPNRRSRAETPQPSFLSASAGPRTAQPFDPLPAIISSLPNDQVGSSTTVPLRTRPWRCSTHPSSTNWAKRTLDVNLLGLLRDLWLCYFVTCFLI